MRTDLAPRGVGGIWDLVPNRAKTWWGGELNTVFSHLLDERARRRNLPELGRRRKMCMICWRLGVEKCAIRPGGTSERETRCRRIGMEETRSRGNVCRLRRFARQVIHGLYRWLSRNVVIRGRGWGPPPHGIPGKTARCRYYSPLRRRGTDWVRCMADRGCGLSSDGAGERYFAAFP